jgi:hypothetical protein|mmetsp:Transcript_43643/g.71170  ORF Transcript_43643/g.71170 Transcript_43643/m.71170 type:complete len:207 (+) Transcript_43643:222-842(+)
MVGCPTIEGIAHAVVVPHSCAETLRVHCTWCPVSPSAHGLACARESGGARREIPTPLRWSTTICHTLTCGLGDWEDVVGELSSNVATCVVLTSYDMGVCSDTPTDTFATAKLRGAFPNRLREMTSARVEAGAAPGVRPDLVVVPPSQGFLCIRWKGKPCPQVLAICGTRRVFELASGGMGLSRSCDACVPNKVRDVVQTPPLVVTR